MIDPILWSLENRDINALHGYAKNPRKISDHQLAKLKEQIKHVGYHHPISIQPDGTIISGHQRVIAFAIVGIVTWALWG